MAAGFITRHGAVRALVISMISYKFRYEEMSFLNFIEK